MHRENWEIFLQQALQEDRGAGDLTTEALVPPTERLSFHMVAREAGIVAGLPWALRVFLHLDPDLSYHQKVEEEEKVTKNQILVVLQGQAQALLAAERIALNLVQRLSGIATKTRRIVEKVADWDCAILDTRKTTPGMRFLERYAVRVGGGQNHRFSLHHTVMIKDNHWPFISDFQEALQKIQKLAGPYCPIIVEVETREQLEVVLSAGVKHILLDNFPVEELQWAVHRVGDQAFLEASGGITEDTVAHVAATGVNAISMGGLTQAALALDIGLDVSPQEEFE